MSTKRNKKRMGRGQKLLCLAAACAAMVGVYFGVTALTGGEDVVETEGSFNVANLSTEEIVSLSWTHEEEEISLSRGEEGWTYDGDAAFPLAQDDVETMVETVANLHATRALQGGTNLADYGLEEPAFRLTVGLADGSTLHFDEGNQNEINGEYYLKFSENEAVYTIAQALSLSFDYGLYDLLTPEETPVVSQADRLVIDGDHNLVDVSRTEDGGEQFYTDAYTWFATGDAEKPMDTELVETLLDEIAGLSWVNCVQYSANEEALETYGLLNPQRIVRVDGTDADDEAMSVTMYLGVMDAEATGYYAQPSGSERVYLVGVEAAESLMAATNDSLRATEILTMDYEDVTAITATLDGTDYDIQIEHGTPLQETEDGVVEATEDVCTVNGESADALQVDTLFSALTALASDGLIPEGTQTGEEVLSLSLLREGHAFPQVDLAFYAYDAEHYVVEMFGERRLLTSAADVDRIVRLIKTL